MMHVGLVWRCCVASMMDDVESTCLVKECRELEEWYGFKVVDAILLDSSDDGAVSLKKKKEEIRQLDRQDTGCLC